ncbi:hypothetical protein HFN89_05710 [Rhizobium laguerreae]|nr:hypothetical protein [Rhizobium laguerreae]
MSLGRVLINTAKRGEDWRAAVDDRHTRHIVDWLKAALVNDESWLHELDHLGRPRKLMKFSDVGGVLKEANKAMLIAAQRQPTVRLRDGDEVLYADLGDGFHMIRLMTEAALDWESAEMQHCIGQGAYDRDLRVPEHRAFLSLRDGFGKAHATLEIWFTKNQCIQIQGKQNKPPQRQYMNRIIPFLTSRGLSMEWPEHIGYAIDIDGRWHSLGELPDGFVSERRLSLKDTGVRSLPVDMRVPTLLYLDPDESFPLPAGLDVGTLSANGGTYPLAERSRVRQQLDISSSGITALPDDVRLDGDLHMRSTPIQVLPPDLRVGGNLDACSSQLRHLSNGLDVGGDLSLVACRSLKELPNDMKVGGHINISGTQVKRLPDSLPEDQQIKCDAGEMTAGEFRDLFGRDATSRFLKGIKHAWQKSMTY